MKETKKWISLLHKKAIADPRVHGMMQFGSSLQSTQFRDIDIALFISSNLSETEFFQLRLDYLKEVPEYFDIKIFNQLPVVIQHEVLKGKVIFAEDLAYKLSYFSIQEYEDFVKYRNQYKRTYLNAN